MDSKEEEEKKKSRCGGVGRLTPGLPVSDPEQ